jgi:hypothetical protein
MLSVVGFVRRGHLQRKFGVSEPQASLDLQQFLALFPHVMTYDNRRKCYVASDDYAPAPGWPHATVALAAIADIVARALADGSMARPALGAIAAVLVDFMPRQNQLGKPKEIDHTEDMKPKERRHAKDPARIASGRKGGLVRSKAKTAAVRANGKLGGRPKSVRP